MEIEVHDKSNSSGKVLSTNCRYVLDFTSSAGDGTILVKLLYGFEVIYSYTAQFNGIYKNKYI